MSSLAFLSSMLTFSPFHLSFFPNHLSFPREIYCGLSFPLYPFVISHIYALVYSILLNFICLIGKSNHFCDFTYIRRHIYYSVSKRGCFGGFVCWLIEVHYLVSLRVLVFQRLILSYRYEIKTGCVPDVFYGGIVQQSLEIFKKLLSIFSKNHGIQIIDTILKY